MKNQIKRINELRKVLKSLKEIANQGYKGQSLEAILRGYCIGWIEGKNQKSPEPCVYFAVLRGGNVIHEIESSILMLGASIEKNKVAELN